MKRQINKVKQILYATSFLTMIVALVFVTVATVEAVIATENYVIYKNGANIYAQNGQTGVDDFSGTDASTVIQSAINALPATGGEIFIKEGTYSIASNFMAGVTKPVTILFGDATFSVTAGVTIAVTSPKIKMIGAGIGRTIFLFSNTGAVDGWQVTSGQSDSYFGGFTVNMQNIGTGAGFKVLGSFVLGKIEDIEVINSGGVGFHFLAITNGAPTLCLFSGLLALNNAGVGILVDAVGSNTGVNRNTFLNCHSNVNGGGGVLSRADGGTSQNSGNLWLTLRCVNNTGDGFKGQYERAQCLINSEIEGNTGYGINWDVNSQGIITMNAGFTGNTLGDFNKAGTIATEWGGYNIPFFPGANIYVGADADYGLIVKAHSAASTGDLLSLQYWDSTPSFRVKANGKLSGNGVAPVIVTSEAVGVMNLYIERIAGQTADLQQWANESGGVLASISNTGSLRTQGISKTSTPANNLSGQATLNAGTGSLGVTFPTAEPNASYYIQLTGNGNNVLWVTNKTATGFTINRSSTTGTRIVDWLLVR